MFIDFSIKKKFLVLFGAIVLIVSISGIANYRQISAVNGNWESYLEQIAKRQEYLLSIQAQFGYGGAIHNFKNFVLRGSKKYAERFLLNYDKITITILRYQSLENLSEIEQQALLPIQKTADAYKNQLFIIMKMVKAGATIGEIDKIVKIDDSPALRAFESLNSEYQLLTMKMSEVMSTSVITSLNIVLASLFATLMVIVFFGFLIGRSITDPMAMITSAVTDVANGNLSVSIDYESRDEIGALARATNIMAENLQELVMRIRENSDKVVSDSRSINRNMQKLNKNSDEQQMSVDETSSSVEQLGRSIREIGKNTTSLSSAALSISNTMQQLAGSIRSLEGKSSNVITSVDSSSSAVEEMAVSIEQVSNSAKEIVSAATTTSASSRNVNDLIISVGGNSDRISGSVDEMSSAIEQLASNINEVRLNAEVAGKTAAENSKDAMAGRKALDTAITAMQNIKNVVTEAAQEVEGLSKSAQDIGEIVNVIDDIAEQTNLLALNAAIEAARAGEHGKGFAVVAEEVRKLAERSQSATKDISKLISGIQRKSSEAVASMEKGTQEVAEGSRLAENSGRALQTIVDGAEKNLEIVSIITRATMEQATASEQVINSVSNVSDQVDGIGTAIGDLKAAGNDIVEKVSMILNMAEQISKAAIEQTNASRHITGMVSGMRDHTHSMISAMKKQTDDVRKTAEEITRMSGEIQQIDSAIKEQESGANLIIAAVEKVHRMAEDNHLRVTSTREDTERIAGSASELGVLIEQFKISGGKGRRILSEHE